MPSRLPSLLAALALVVALLFYTCAYEVRSTEVALIKTFGKADRDAIDEPGLRFKWPWPIQEVVPYDKRIRILEDTVEETPTADGKNITITTFTGWRIKDPYEFHRSYPNEEMGEQALRTKVRAYKKQIVGLHRFAEFVSTQEEERRIREIEAEMQTKVAEEAAKEFGVEIRMFGIKKLGLPKDVTNAIFEFMKAEQKKKATSFEEEGKAKAREIVAQAEAKKQLIMSFAQKQVDDIESDGRRKVGEIYKRFEKHPELRIFLDKLQAFEAILATRTFMILDTRMMPIDLLLLDQGAVTGGELMLEPVEPTKVISEDNNRP
jgi:regulator of protease activity HflC (stomatin/prohibitin superfamily)